MNRRTRKDQAEWLQCEREVDSTDNGYDSNSEDDNEAFNDSEEQLSESEYSDSDVDKSYDDSDVHNNNNNNNDNNNNNSGSDNNDSDEDEEDGEKLLGKDKPEILTFYNMTKEDVDVVDELKANYSVARETDRWPMTIERTADSTTSSYSKQSTKSLS
ncbi:putative uncharacterized protein DDB_G0292330 [Neodiprion pinetum]|uniref:putative uncharacterized protein DDB_G0292330 n=1 Tax=Neodiprion pinetum TaxID=441929 RepID=UPI0037101073